MLSATAYLSDLLDFAFQRVAGEQATAAALGTSFSQRFAQAAVRANAPVATAPVPQARIAVEVLRDYLQRRTSLSGAPLNQRNAADRRFLRAAYQAVLRGFGTSADELRAARTADDATRAALAGRLGLETLTVAELDALAFDPDTVTAAQLEDTYGVLDTTRDPYAPAARPLPLLLERRLTHLHNRWQREDDAAGEPVVDPDLVRTFDIPPGSQAGQLRAARRAQVDAELAAKSSLVTQALAAAGATHNGVFATVVDGVLGAGAVAQLDKLGADERAGRDIGPGVAALHLELAAFRRLSAIRALAASNSVRKGEWADVVAILVAVRKRRDFRSAWRAEESGLWLGPGHLRVGAEPARLDDLPAWLTTPAARVAWESSARARAREEQAVREAFAATVQAAETAPLARLRDDLVAVVGAARPSAATPPGPFSADVAADRLTDELVIDLAARGTAITSRLDQAIETLQGVLFAVRAKRLKTAFPVLGANPATGASGWALTQANGYSDAKFDEEWRFMGEHGTWRGAISLFFWPETLLQPTLRKPPAPGQLGATFATASFLKLADRVRGDLGLTPAGARAAAKEYLTNLRLEFPTAANPTLPAVLRDDAKVQITDQLTDAQLAHRRDVLLATATVAGQPGTVGQDYALFAPSGSVNTTFHDSRVWLAEAFFFVPLLLAQQLEKSGQHLAALDWLRTVYAYDLPLPERKIYRGLRLEEPATGSALPQVARSIDWLLGDGMQPHQVAVNRPGSHTRATLLTAARLLLAFADAEFARETRESLPRARQLYDAALELLDTGRPEFTPQKDAKGVPLPPNPVLAALVERATGGLRKLRFGFNALGLERGLTRRPTPYRYVTLIDRAQRLVATAQQMEERFLAAVQSAESEAYNLLKARQDITVARAGVQLQDLRVTEAQAGVELGELQRGGAVMQRDHAQTLLDRATGVNELATVVGAGLRAAFAVASVVPGIGALPSAFFNGLGALTPGNGVAVANAIGLPGALGAVGSFLDAASSFERQREDLTVKLALADQDVAIAEQQIDIAQLHVGVVEQERTISRIQLEHAQATLDFLANKFGNAELFEWMAGVLAEIYRYFLLQATVIARLAERQLRFERHEELPAFIRPDYWEPSDGAGAAGPDRRGLTGAEQLLRDLAQLDQYAFTTDRRRLQLSKTISLASADPVAFQRFRETGVLTFATSGELFDRDHPGHYMRLVKGVRTTMVALVPSAQGIRATLTSAGTSRVVVENGGGFSTVAIAHGSEQVALSSPTNATGLFELDAQPELRAPFEGFGVDTMWELRLPKAANPFEFRTLFDVLFTVEYTALDSALLREETIRTLDPRVSTDRAFSVRNDLPDQWFDLNNPDQSATPMRIRVPIGAPDFPPNLEELEIDHVLVYAAAANGQVIALTVDELALTPPAATEPVKSEGAATTVDGIISTRRGNGAPWQPLLDRAPFGEWDLRLRDTPELRDAFAAEQITDLVFVLTVEGRTPAWPD